MSRQTQVTVMVALGAFLAGTFGGLQPLSVGELLRVKHQSAEDELVKRLDAPLLFVKRHS